MWIIHFKYTKNEYKLSLPARDKLDQSSAQLFVTCQYGKDNDPFHGLAQRGVIRTKLLNRAINHRIGRK